MAQAMLKGVEMFGAQRVYRVKCPVVSPFAVVDRQILPQTAPLKPGEQKAVNYPC
jgi:hypothetical protein